MASTKSTPLASNPAQPTATGNDATEMISIQETLDCFADPEPQPASDPQPPPAPQQHMYTDAPMQIPVQAPVHPPVYQQPPHAAVHAMHVYPMYPPVGYGPPEMREEYKPKKTVTRPSPWTLMFDNIRAIKDVRFAIFVGLLFILLQLCPNDLFLGSVLPASITHNESFTYLARGALAMLVVLIVKNWNSMLPVQYVSDDNNIMPDEADMFLS